MERIISILFYIVLASSCMTEDIHTLLKNQEDHEIRIQEFEALCKTINETSLALQAIVEATHTGDYITHIQQTEKGYILTFAQKGSFTLYHGQKGEIGDPGEDGENGKDGQDGTNGTPGQNGQNGVQAPVIGIGEDEGIYYWTQTLDGITEWLYTPEGQRMKVHGDKGDPGIDGTPGQDGQSPIPILGIDDQGYWLLNGVRIKDVNGKEVKAKGDTGLPGTDGADAPSGVPGSGLFKEVSINAETVTFELLQPSGTKFTLPRYEPMTLTLSENQILNFSYGSHHTLTYMQTGISELHFIPPSRWRVDADTKNCQIKITAPVADEPNIEFSGVISILAFNGKGQSLQVTIEVAIDFN